MENSLLEAQRETTLLFIAEKIWVCSFLEVYVKKKKSKTIEFKSINYLRPWRGVEFHAILCTGFFHPVLVSAFYTCKRLRPVLSLPRHSWDIKILNKGKGTREKNPEANISLHTVIHTKKNIPWITGSWQ